MSVCESWWRASFTRLMLVAVLAGAGQLAMADDLDVTMRMVDDSEDLTGAVTREIRLPELPGLRRHERGNTLAPGRATAEDARERGRDFGQSVSERARENRRGKPDIGRDSLPETVRDLDELRPELPSPPSRP
ncbi:MULTISPECIES: hypothetical protein [Marinobacter]|uniref:hypothetical protein n=1 Tax=Marinobacter TaxID=2742 RepID=UPI000718E815|nr:MULTISPECIES: hypothetical protein [Marinobacter]MDX5439377.1 hypothetical protein [Alteromonadaceae bacterium]AMQ89794.1 hypothetical protein ASQ50_14410 [Marinobacter sp. LQ44]MCD1629566.1 hypothetical protein [Marinobacter shengliensis]MDX5336789.1 hypothetical protein [Marinobacter sp.]MDX5387947.1 hypothetical protein [Marinobacter sp.]